MPSFRPALLQRSAATSARLAGETVRAVIAEAMAPAHFFAAGSLALAWEHRPQETIPWEIHRGRLLDRSQTRQEGVFEAWQVFARDAAGRSGEPLLAVQLDSAAEQVHVTRAIHCYVWEGYDAGGNVYQSRETRRWLRELVGTIRLADVVDVATFRDELLGLLFRGVVGMSRLPLASLEAPLPGFSLGELGYFYRAGLAPQEQSVGPLCSWQELLDRAWGDDLAELEQAKLLELCLRTAPAADVADLAARLARIAQSPGWSATRLGRLFRVLFNEVALSPYTGFVDRTLTVWQALVERGTFGPADHADFLCHLLRQASRHLTAYDLITFHHRGANYPDALLLDAVLRALLGVIVQAPHLFTDPADRQQRLRRRGLRQGWLLWHRYAGLPVPEVPTSQGENQRVLPPSFPRVTDEQLQSPLRRPRRLFADASLPCPDAVAGVLRQSVDDLGQAEELWELGTGLFLDRPFSTGRHPIEPDATLLVSYVAFSRAIAEQRLAFLAERLALLDAARAASLRGELARLAAAGGIAPRPVPDADRPGAVSLNDMLRASPDFVLLRSTRRSIEDFLAQFDFGSLRSRLDLAYLHPDRPLLLVREPGDRDRTATVLAVYDAQLQKRLELEVSRAQGFATRGGQEFPAAGLRVLRAWEPREIELSAEELVVPSRW